MSVTLDVNGTEANSTTTATTAISFAGPNISAGLTNSVLVVSLVFGNGSSNVTAPSTLTRGAQTLNLIGSTNNGTFAGNQVAWYGLVNPTSGTGTITGTFASAVWWFGQGSSFQGVNQTGGTSSFANYTGASSGSATTLNDTITTANGDYTVIVGLFGTIATTPWSAPTGLVQTYKDTSLASVFTNASGAQHASTTSSDLWTGNNASSDVITIAGFHLVASAGAASLPPGKQSFETPQRDDNSQFPRQLRTFTSLDNRLQLQGQDKFNPGQQSYATPDAWLVPERFAQWRTWAGWYNQNLIGQDQFPPGQVSYDLPAGQVPDTFARWRSWTGSYNLNLIGQDKLPAGKQSWELPAGSIYGQDPFAKWRSWTGSYNLNLIGKDVLPFRNQQDLPRGISWLPDTPSLNLLNTLLSARVSLPPGAQVYDLAPRSLDPYAQVRSWAAWYNLNLIGKDQLVPGQQTNYLPAGAIWRPESPQPNILLALLSVVPTNPVGAQSYDLPPRAGDPFANWRSWSGDYNPNLIAQDIFPIGAQLDDRPDGITWRVDTTPQNLLNTLLAAAPAQIPPGTQLYERPRFFFLM